jgi:catechol 2,3-dioxygenase-like lactoylglutathione lyase family enzyme
MQQQISVVTLGVDDLERSRTFYVEGFGWKPIFENEEIVFYQMNGFVLGTWLADKLDEDMQRKNTGGNASIALAHNVSDDSEVQPLIDRLVAAGGKMLRQGDVPPHGGFRGYVADPDGNSWEIAWNPAWMVDENGQVTFGV